MHPNQVRIAALDAAKLAYLAIGAGDMRSWSEILALRRLSGAFKAESNRKLAALCSRSLEHPDLPETAREPVKQALLYFNGEAIAGPHSSATT